MKLNYLFAGLIFAIGLGLGSGMVAGMANAAPVTPGVDIAQKPHHDDWKHDDWGPGWGRGRWGWNAGVDACISATDPSGYVSGFVCI
ncbi:hypothetical protein ACTWP6_28035 [Mycobacterium sp. 4D054]|uniref:hypothetical protein n=1 Tax=unclassified Mycobacterium TaxID=2642494 RepID=UPI0021B3AC41|nr:hypothetical protein [Mycobacterium sp. SMC-8]UXA14783.1 hypothetical protein KXD97_14055 [Mycobacterium sp. SMC-8]